MARSQKRRITSSSLAVMFDRVIGVGARFPLRMSTRTDGMPGVSMWSSFSGSPSPTNRVNSVPLSCAQESRPLFHSFLA